MSNQNCEEAASENNVGKDESEHLVTWFININIGLNKSFIRFRYLR